MYFKSHDFLQADVTYHSISD